MVLYHVISSIIIGILTGIIAYIYYRKFAVSLWGYISSFLFDAPVLILVPLGVPILSLFNTMVLTHTIGIILFPIITLIADILLIELSLLRILRPISFLGPKSLRTADKVVRLVERLQNYNAIPRPIRVKRVYLVGILAGIMHLLTFLFIGFL